MDVDRVEHRAARPSPRLPPPAASVRPNRQYQPISARNPGWGGNTRRDSGSRLPGPRDKPGQRRPRGRCHRPSPRGPTGHHVGLNLLHAFHRHQFFDLIHACGASKRAVCAACMVGVLFIETLTCTSVCCACLCRETRKCC